MSGTFGFNGKILRVDLTNKLIEEEVVPEILFRKYLGGNTLGLYYLMNEQPAGVDPLSPENTLIFTLSPVTGTPGPGLSRFSVVSKSPLTGGLGESEAGGWWGPELKFAGYDGIIFKGKAPHPVYLFIQDGKAEIKDARHLWGKKTLDTQKEIRQELGDEKVRVALIGPAGENMNRNACILNEIKHANGRSGLGAVMGSKNLKAIAVRGTGTPLLAEEIKVKNQVKMLAEVWRENPGTMTELGTSRGIRGCNNAGMLPTRNFQEGTFENFEDITAEKMIETILVGRGTCYRCYVRCKREVACEAPYKVIPEYGGPEYETIGAFGSACGIGDLKIIAYANQICQEYGLDTISVGVTVSFLMECYERGLATREQLDGLDLKFGNGEAMISLVEKIAKNEGVGAFVGNGILSAVEFLGPESAQYAMHVKGQPLPLHEPRAKVGVGLAFALPAAGPDHMEIQHDPVFATEGGVKIYEALGFTETLDSLDLSTKKVRQFLYLEFLYNMYNAIGICCFIQKPVGPFTITSFVDYINAVTGWNTSLWELLKVGEKHNTMSRIFNLREGLTKDDDMLPDRFFKSLDGKGLNAGQSIDRNQFNAAISTYYQLSGWNNEGVPEESKITELELSWISPVSKGRKFNEEGE